MIPNGNCSFSQEPSIKPQAFPFLGGSVQFNVDPYLDKSGRAVQLTLSFIWDIVGAFLRSEASEIPLCT